MARILIVEDDEDVAATYSQIQTMSGFEVRIEKSAAHVMEAIPHIQPHVCLVDLHLPGESGVSLAPRIREAYPKVGLIAVSAFLEDWTQEELEHVGFDSIMGKPVCIDELRTTITQTIRKYFCPCNENLCMAGELCHVSKHAKIDKTCSRCGKHWATMQDFHDDPSLYPIGSMKRDSKGTTVLQYNHNHCDCGTTGAIEFHPEETDPDAAE